MGVPLPGAIAATVAVRRTGRPKTDGFGLTVIDVWVFALATCCVRTDDVLVMKFASPP